MKRPLTDEELYEIQTLTDSLLESKKKELSLLRDIRNDASYNSVHKLESHIIQFASCSENNFIEGKRLALFTKDGVRTSAYDPEYIGTTETFPAGLTHDNGIWEFYLPPMYSVPTKKYGESSGRYIGYLVRNLIRLHEEEFGSISRLNDPVVVFEHGIAKDLPSSRLFDAENRDNKKVLDALTGTFTEDDNLLSVRTFYYGVTAEDHYTKVFVMETEDFALWAAKNLT